MKTHFSQLFLYLLEQFHRALQSLHSLYVLTWSISEKKWEILDHCSEGQRKHFLKEQNRQHHTQPHNMYPEAYVVSLRRKSEDEITEVERVLLEQGG